MFEDEIVMLGSNISSQIGANITTTVANRKQLDNGNINVFINEYPWAGQYPNKIKSLFISNDQMDESGMGYVFFKSTRTFG